MRGENQMQCNNGHENPSDSTFCNECGARLTERVERTERQPSGVTPNAVAIAAVAIIAVLSLGVGAFALMSSHDTAASAPATKLATTQKAPITTTTESVAAKQQADAAAKQHQAEVAAQGRATHAAAEYKAFVASVETIIGQSTQGRSNLATVLSEVQSGCTTTPAIASGQIGTVIANRTSVLSQLAGLAVPASNAEAVQVRTLLQTALQASIQADNYYNEWMNNLTNDYYGFDTYTYCPYGAPTSYQSYASAQVANGQATAAKNAFVAVFNPIASRFGLPTWSASQF